MFNIVCFGDSNTYGYKPDGSGRFNETIRWTGRLQAKLGAEYRIHEEGLCGRTTVFTDALRENRRGIDVIGTVIESHSPLDLLIIMLGTNDCKKRYGASAGVIAKGLKQVVEKAKKSSNTAFKILIISPIHLDDNVGEEGYDTEFNQDSANVSKQLAKEYERVASDCQAEFIDASKYAGPSDVDREHLDEKGHAALADAIYHKVITMNRENVT